MESDFYKKPGRTSPDKRGNGGQVPGNGNREKPLWAVFLLKKLLGIRKRRQAATCLAKGQYDNGSVGLPQVFNTPSVKGLTY